MERKKHIEKMFNTMLNDVDYIKWNTYEMEVSKKKENV